MDTHKYGQLSVVRYCDGLPITPTDPSLGSCTDFHVASHTSLVVPRALEKSLYFSLQKWGIQHGLLLPPLGTIFHSRTFTLPFYLKELKGRLDGVGEGGSWKEVFSEDSLLWTWMINILCSQGDDNHANRLMMEGK